MPLLRKQLVDIFNHIGESALVKVIALSTLLVSPFFLPSEGLGIDTCWWHALLGVDCPSCGLTRSFTAIAHVRILESFRYHLMGPPLYIMLLIMLADRIFEMIAKGSLFKFLDIGKAFGLAGAGIVLLWTFRLIWSWLIGNYVNSQ